MTAIHAEPIHAVKVDGAWHASIDYHISLDPLGRKRGICTARWAGSARRA